MSCLNFGVIDSGTVHHEDVCPELGDYKIFFFTEVFCVILTHIQRCIEVFDH